MADERWLRASLSGRILGAMLLGLPVLVFVIAAGANERDRASLMPVGLAALLTAGYLGVVIAFARWRVDDRGVERRTPLLKKLRIGWTDVVSIQRGSFGSLVLRGRFGTAVQVPARLTGLDGLRRLALENVPPSAISDAVRRTLEYGAGFVPLETATPVDAPEPADLPQNDPVARWRQNPFFVLGLSPECSRADVERGGQKLLALLAIESSAARRFKTPVGEAERTEEAVRAAMAELRDPNKRLVHEAWARIGADAEVSGAGGGPERAGPWPGAMAAIGWKSR